MVQRAATNNQGTSGCEERLGHVGGYQLTRTLGRKGLTTERRAGVGRREWERMEKMRGTLLDCAGTFLLHCWPCQRIDMVKRQGHRVVEGQGPNKRWWPTRSELWHQPGWRFKLKPTCGKDMAYSYRGYRVSNPLKSKLPSLPRLWKHRSSSSPRSRGRVYSPVPIWTVQAAHPCYLLLLLLLPQSAPTTPGLEPGEPSSHHSWVPSWAMQPASLAWCCGANPVVLASETRHLCWGGCFLEATISCTGVKPLHASFHHLF